jgi:hypothetical protein
MRRTGKERRSLIARSKLGAALVQSLAEQDNSCPRAVSSRGKRRPLGAALGRAFQERLGQAVVVENKPGAGGNIAATEAARAQADGYTLFVGTNGTQTINQSLYRHLSCDPAADFTAIGMMWSAPHLAVVYSAIPARSLDGFVAYARARAGELSLVPRESVRQPVYSPKCLRRAPGSRWCVSAASVVGLAGDRPYGTGDRLLS